MPAMAGIHGARNNALLSPQQFPLEPPHKDVFGLVEDTPQVTRSPIPHKLRL